jgi:hypothetical protein
MSDVRLTLRQRRIAEDLGILNRLPSTTEMWSRILLDLTTEGWPAFVLIDEFDAALLDRLSSQRLLFELRRVYDDTLYGMCIIIGLKGEPKDVMEKLGPALFSRMSLQPIYLPPLSKSDAVDFLVNVLAFAYGERKEKFSPFTKEAIETLADLSCPCTPRRLLRVASVIFEESRITKLAKIDKDFVLEVVAKFGEISVSIPSNRSKETKERPSVLTSNELEGIVEYGSNGTINILANPSEFTAKEAIGIVLYAKRPLELTMREIRTQVIRNWKNISMQYISANLNGMRKEVISSGKKGDYKFRLSGLGESWVATEVLPKLKGEKQSGEEVPKKDKRGGKRSPLVSQKIDEMIEENYFKLPNKRSVEDVVRALVEKKGLPVTGKSFVVLAALKRRLGHTLVGTREDKKWFFWTE